MNEKVNMGTGNIIPQSQESVKQKKRWLIPDSKPIAWQVIRLTAAEGGDDDREPVETTTITAKNAVEAYTLAAKVYPGYKLGAEIVTYPLATLAPEGEGIDYLAKYTAKQFRKWQIRNENAVFQGLTVQDREDQAQTAALAIWQGLLADEGIDMYALYKIGYNAICAERDQMFRKKEKSYNPDRLPRVFGTFVAKNGPLGALFAEAAANAAKSGKLTEKQMSVLDMYARHWTGAEMAAEMGIRREKVYKHLHAGLHNVLDQMIQIDLANGLRTFARHGITPEEVYEALAEEARKRKN